MTRRSRPSPPATAPSPTLALARLLRRRAGSRAHALIGSPATAETTLAPFGTGPLDPGRFAAWQADTAPPVPRRHVSRAGQRGPPRRPPLLRAAHAAPAWMAAGIVDAPTPLQAVLTAVALSASAGAARCVCVPVWAAYPAAGFGDRAALPGCAATPPTASSAGAAR